MATYNIKKEFLNEGEKAIEYKIVEDNGDRLLISPVVWNHGSIVPVELVRKNMIEVI